MRDFLLLFAVIILCIASLPLAIWMWAEEAIDQYRMKKNRDKPTAGSPPSDLALIALPVVYVQPYGNGVIIQDSKQRLHYFTDRGYSWEPLENIEL